MPVPVIRVLLSCLISCLLLLVPNSGRAEQSAGCHLADQNKEKEILRLLKQKEKAVNEHKWKLYVPLLNSGKPMYIQEQKRWFQDAVKVMKPGSFHIHPVCFTELSENRVKVHLEQTYRLREEFHRVSFPVLFERTRNGWKDSDLVFARLGNGMISVYYTDASLQKLARLAFSSLSKGVAAFNRKYGWTPGRVEVKLYQDPELFRESVKPSLPGWAAGWHEANQSIKFIAENVDPAWFASGMIHELTHQLISELTNDNAAYWLQEGAAMFYEAHLLPDFHWIHSVPRQFQPLSIAELEQKRLERLPSDEAGRYYLSAYLQFKNLVETYGEEKLKKVFEILKASPYLDVDSDQKVERLNRLTHDALNQVLGHR
ncbi:hypothetical protein [Thermoactinomyces sp. CICC 10522]|uniref:peptidase MA family metallohydrolase n=1 Tax=Thermoactinomyces sp. CICC 10522 TaxID=2767427 RepID=UPI0018DE6FE4|nr:hypothetical protein [Thermoactinomyces sp. CICC 10522]MBH8605473.1 hypothetical protein [Thermoactinomyces sp. CICC 10522]